jgi:hypothetical protein
MSETRVLGIGAWDRSGSTILANTLGAPKGLISVGEINNLWHRGVVEDRMCACGESFSACPFWSPVMKIAFDHPAGRSLLEAVIGAHDRLGNIRVVAGRMNRQNDRDAATYVEGLASLYEAISRRTDGSTIIDSSKKPWHLALATQTPGVVGYTLHLVRDPRGVVHSLKKTISYDRDRTRPTELDRHGSTFAALGWRYRNALMAWSGRRDGNYLRVHYEDFARNPKAKTKEILAWLGHADAEIPFQAPDSVRLETNHTVSGNPVRFQTGVVQIGVDDEWRRQLGVSRRLWVDVLTWPMLIRYGYGL